MERQTLAQMVLLFKMVQQVNSPPSCFLSCNSWWSVQRLNTSQPCFVLSRPGNRKQKTATSFWRHNRKASLHILFLHSKPEFNSKASSTCKGNWKLQACKMALPSPITKENWRLKDHSEFWPWLLYLIEHWLRCSLFSLRSCLQSILVFLWQLLRYNFHTKESVVFKYIQSCETITKSRVRIFSSLLKETPHPLNHSHFPHLLPCQPLIFCPYAFANFRYFIEMESQHLQHFVSGFFRWAWYLQGSSVLWDDLIPHSSL